MLGNYLKIASRNIAKRKLYSFINAFGLSIGMAFCILIFLFIRDERSFDQFHANKERIYRIEENSYNYWNPDLEEKDRWNRSAYIQLGFLQALKEELPEVELGTRFSEGTAVVKNGDRVFKEEITFVDGDFFRMFSFPLIAGNRDKLFSNTLEAVITPAMAEKYFGEEDPIGKILTIEHPDARQFIVAGLIDAPPANSSFDFRILIPQENKRNYDVGMTRWGNFNTPTFVLLEAGTDMQKFRASIVKVMDKHVGPRLDDWRREAGLPKDKKILEYLYTALPDMHMDNSVGWHKASDPQYSYILGGIALLILAIACINYISLSLTTSTARKTEVGIRKVVGAVRNQLVYQFGLESVVLATISAVISIGLVLLFLPSFNTFTGKGIELTGAAGGQLLAGCLLLGVFVGGIAGSYPAFFLSRFRPALVLKGNYTAKVQARFTKPLVVLQFFLSAFLIISSVIMYKQMSFVTQKDLGYNQRAVLVVPTHAHADAHAAERMVAQLRTRLEQEAEVMSVAGTSISFNQGWSRNGYRIDGETKAAFVYAVDPYYIPTLGIELVMGRNFDPNIPADSNAVIVNEALVRDMKWDDPLSAHLNWTEDTVGLGPKVIGVVKDYHYRSLEAPIEPLLMSMNKRAAGSLGTVMIRVKPDDLLSAMEKVRAVWKELFPDKPYDYTFLEEDVASQYSSYERWMKIMGLATGFAILISCLGLFGLAGINAVNRTREIGIRKVMGAQVTNIFVLLNRQYVLLALIAFTLAIPFSWYAMEKWLADFEFKITIGWEIFAASLAAGLLIALATVSYHAIKAALVNPAQTLKYE